jgi:PAS domain S-box-containing protein
LPTDDVAGAVVTAIDDFDVGAVLRRSDAAVISTDLDGIVSSWSAGAEALYGWTPDEAVGRSIVELLVPEPSTPRAREIMAAVVGGRPWSGAFTVRRKGGTTVNVLAIDVAIFDEDQRPAGVLGISVLRPLEGRATEDVPSERSWWTLDRFRRSLAASGIGTWFWNADTGEVAWDSVLEGLYGLAPGSGPRTYDEYLELIHPEDREPTQAQIADSLERGDTHRVMHRMIRSDGAVRWIQGWGEVLKQDGRTIGMVGAALDVTEQVERDAQIRRTTDRIGRLQSVTAALAGAETVEEVGKVAMHELLEAVDATGGNLLLRRGDELHLVASNLPDHVVLEGWRSFSVDAPYAGARAVRTRRIVRVPAAEASGPLAAAAAEGGSPIVVAVPLFGTGQRSIGGVGLAVDDAPSDDPEWELFLYTIGRQVGQALERAMLREAERRANARLRFLAEASEVLASSLDFEETIAHVADVVVPTFADWCTVDVLNDAGELELVAVAHADPEKVEYARELRSRFPPSPGDSTGAWHVISTGQPELTPVIPPEAIEQAIRERPEVREILDRLQLTSLMVLPLQVRGETLGAISFVWAESGRHYDEEDVAAAWDLARRAASAIDNARLYAASRRVADTLERSLRPPDLPSVPGLDVAARYVPAGSVERVGGDFYDVFETVAGSWTAVIGDVSGKGVEAAGLMALSRFSVRTAGLSVSRPSEILLLLNEAIIRSRSDRFCTAQVLRLRLGADDVRVTLSSGGHPLPFVVRTSGDVERVEVHGTLLGLFEAPELEDVVLDLSPGDAVVLFTDGVLESRSGDVQFGEERLRDVLEAGPARTADEIASSLVKAVESFADEGLTDDVAILVLRVPPRRSGRPRTGPTPAPARSRPR